MTLFQNKKEKSPDFRPLAERRRPKNLEEFVGQKHLVGEGGLLREVLKQGLVPSMIFWGEPGCGKTTLARLLASRQDLTLKELSATESGVREVRNVIDFARLSRDTYGKKTIVFIDEIHRFSKSQQDTLLRAVEDGTIILIGATTENPSFEVIPPLLSRARIVKFDALIAEDLEAIFERAVSEDELVAKSHSVFEVPARETLIKNSSGDARILLNAMELAIELTPESDGKRNITEATVRKALQSKTVYHDKKGDYHYDLASAFIKSMRASDPDAAIYYMARMLIAGEDPQFLARRMVILASEDIGNANPNALLLATACFQAVSMVGMPEARIILAQTCAYLASSPKSNASYVAINEAMKEAETNPDIPVPLKLRNPVTASMKAWDYGADYKYPHSFPGHFIEDPCLPEELMDKIFYRPTDFGSEKAIKERLEAWWSKRRD